MGEENLLVKLAGGSNPSLNLGLQLRGGAMGFPLLGAPSCDLLGSDRPSTMTDR